MTCRVFVQLEIQANHPNIQLRNRDCSELVSVYWFDREACEDRFIVSDDKLKSDCKCIVIKRRLLSYQEMKIFHAIIKLLGVQLCFRRFPIDGFSGKWLKWWSK